MSNSDWKDLPDRRERRFLLGVVVALGLGAFLVVRPYAGWVLLSLFLGYVAWPVRAVLVTRRVPRWLAAGVVTILVTVLAIAPFALIAWQLSDDLGRFAEQVGERGPEFFVARLMRAAGVPSEARDALLSGVQGALTAAAERAVPMASSVAVGSVLAVFLLYATLADGDRLVAWFRRYLPLSEGRRELLFDSTRRGLDAIVFGVIAVSLVQGVTAGVGWWLFGLPEPIFWGFVLVVASLIPYVGVYIVLFPAVAWIASTGDVTRAIGFLLYSMLIVGTVDNVVRPILIGRRGGIHPAIVLVGVVGGVPAFGAMGVVIGPLVLSLFLAALGVLRRPDKAEREGREILEQEEDEPEESGRARPTG